MDSSANSMVSLAPHNPFHPIPLGPQETGNSSVPSFHSQPGNDETTLASQLRPPLPPRRANSLPAEDPPEYTSTPSTFSGETTLELGPRRPFQPAPQVVPQPTGQSSAYASPSRSTQSAPRATSNTTSKPSPRWLSDITRNPAVHQAFGVARQVTGDLRRELRNMESNRRGAATRSQPNNSSSSYYSHTINGVPVDQSYSTTSYAPPPGPPPPPMPSLPQPQSDFAREFYAAGTGEFPTSQQGDSRGSDAYAPEPGPRRARLDGNVPLAGDQGIPDDGRPTTTPVPGHPLLHNGKMLVYPKSHFCQKCQNTGYKQYDPSNPCSKCWSKYSKPYEGALTYADFNAPSPSESSSKTFQRPLPSFGGSLSTISALPPGGLSAPPSSSHRRWSPFNNPPNGGFSGPMRPLAPWGGNGFPHVQPPSSFAPGPVMPAGDARIGGVLCWRCRGKGRKNHLGGLVEEICPKCGGLGRIR
ncbi:hypothetical protein DL96DRAFT_1614851 [Flagelloscypha sp. PMI_526]|nr:hypothetical protein DL96DRAFT_1614851 [Flagelloscypha sp. PMI_526]